MQRYMIRRLLLMVPTLFGVTFTVFLMVRAVPGDVTTQILGEFGATDKETKEQILKDFSLDKNPAIQYVNWITDLAQFDFGKSIISGRTVTSELSNRLPVTFELSILAILVSLSIALPVGIMSAIRQDSWMDYVGRSFAIGLLAIPGFWVGLVLITMAGRYFQWGVPPRTYIPITDDPIGNLKMMAMPAIILGSGLSGGVMRFTRSAMLEVLRQDYIRTARAKGLKPAKIILKHALRNAMIPPVTLLGLQFALLIGGAVVTENVFARPGLGTMLVDAVLTKDMPLVQALIVYKTGAYVFINVIIDLLYGIIDPRVRLERAS